MALIAASTAERRPRTYAAQQLAERQRRLPGRGECARAAHGLDRIEAAGLVEVMVGGGGQVLLGLGITLEGAADSYYTRLPDGSYMVVRYGGPSARQRTVPLAIVGTA
jgi:hypothetical protein